MTKKMILMLLMLVSGSAFSAGKDSEALQALLRPIATLQASFDQTIKSEQGRILQRCSGKVWLKKPGQFRWEVLGKEPRLVVSDGKKVWDFDKDLEQVTVQKLNQGQSKAPIFFLTGEVKSLDRDFTVQALPLEKGHCLKKSDTCFELTPKKGEGSFQWIRIGFKAGQLKEMELLDQLGQDSQFLFTHLHLNTPVLDEQFHFTPPPNVDVLLND